MANPDFETVVKMKPPAWHIGNVPVFAGKQKDRKMQRKKVAAVFNDSIFGF